MCQEMEEEVRLLFRLHRVDHLHDPFSRGSGRGGLHPHCILGYPDGEGVHSVRHGGRKEHGLPVPGSPAKNVLDLWTEPHVQHPVRLVQDQGSDPAQIHVPLLHVIIEAPRRGGNDLEAFLERLDLGAVAHPAHDVPDPDAGAPGQGRRILRHLLCQLPGGAEHEDL